MPIPDYQSIMLPLLKYASDQKQHSMKQAYEDLANEFNLTTEEKNELLPSGTQQIYKNRIGWARTYLSKAGLLESKKRGYFNITDRGIEFLATNPIEINNKDLEQFDEFIEFKSKKNESQKIDNTKISSSETPEETIENAISDLNSNLAIELLENLKNVSPNYFERIVVELLVKMGYGGSRKEAGEVVGKSGDGGIDGIIKEDKLGLDLIYIQAKRWDNVVSRPEIQKFVGVSTSEDVASFLWSLFTGQVVDESTLSQMAAFVEAPDQDVPLQTGYGLGIRNLSTERSWSVILVRFQDILGLPCTIWRKATP